MTNKIAIVLAAAFVAFVAAVLAPRAGAQSWPQPPHVMHWQQECIFMLNEPRPINQLLLDRGNAGWEFVGLTAIPTSGVYACFKRRGP